MAVSPLTVASLIVVPLQIPPSLPPPTSEFAGRLLPAPDCRLYVGIAHSEWTLTHRAEKKAFSNVSFVTIAWLFKRTPRETCRMFYMLAQTDFLSRLSSFQTLKYRVLLKKEERICVLIGLAKKCFITLPHLPVLQRAAWPRLSRLGL